MKDQKHVLSILLLFFFPIVLSAQNDVTKFLDIPVDGFEKEMKERLQSKGFSISEYNDEILEGEFNGTDVQISIVTDNNKVWRIALSDAVFTDELNIKIRFNTLIEQFMNSEKYVAEPDSTIALYTIPEDEDISYEMIVNKKRYEAVFYQKSTIFESLSDDELLALLKEQGDEEAGIELDQFLKENPESREDILNIFRETGDSLNSLNKTVWFTIQNLNGEYGIIMFYDNELNKADGSEL